MQEQLEEVIALQAVYSDQNTPDMARRGLLVRDQIPKEMDRFSVPLRKVLGDFGVDATAEGRDGTGRKTRIPWVRWYSPSRSPSAQNGWYLVYLFHPEAVGVSLCLSHGSTSLQNGAFVSRSDDEVRSLMDWASRVVGAEFQGDHTVRPGIELGPHQLAQAYERTTVFSKFYAAGAVPNDDGLLQDLIRFSEPLRKLYRAQELGLTPGDTHPDVVSLQDEVERFTSPLKNSGQGRGLSGPLRKLVEMHAMGKARDWLSTMKFDFKDVSLTESCDFHAKRDGEDWIIEVKGTTGGPGTVLLTRNEVALHRRAHPRNALLIVHGIELDKVNFTVRGGELFALSPWLLDEERLDPICFEYRTPL
jgi:hypothetical protein